jgi:exodeoxyribonuclease V alpha subunit
MQDLGEVLERLRQSEFRSGIRLRRKESDYLSGKGMDTILSHASDFIEKRLAPALPANDGKQTPWRNHPVFVAQHATATCCRGCLEKWHRIPKGRELTEAEQQYIVALIKAWLSQHEANTEQSLNASQRT